MIIKINNGDDSSNEFSMLNTSFITFGNKYEVSKVKRMMLNIKMPILKSI